MADGLEKNAVEHQNAPAQEARATGFSYRRKFQEDKFRNTIISDIARDIHDRRWDANKSRWLREYNLPLDPDQIRQLLIDNRIDPDTDKATKFMEKWDWEQAVRIYESIYGSEPRGKESLIKTGAGVKKEPEHKYDLPEEERDPVKAMALHTIHKVKNFDDLNAPTLEEGDRKIIELTRELWNEFATHGFVDPDPVTGEIIDPKTGKPRIKGPSDLDGRSFLAILKKAGIKVENVEYTPQRKLPESESGVVGDTAGEEGVVAKEGGKLLIFDHHGKASGRDTSATKYAFDTLKKFGLLNEEHHDLKALENFVDFVTKEDNKDYSDEEIKLIINNYGKNLISLQRYLSEEQLMKVFEDYSKSGLDLNPYDELPRAYLETLQYQMPGGKPIEAGKEHPVDIVGKRLSNLKNAALNAVEKMKNDGYVVDIGGHFGEILIDTGTVTGETRKKKLKGGIDIEVARYLGFGGIVWWNPEKNNFSVQTAEKLDVEFSDGFNSRGHYWLKIPDEEKLKTTLQEILGKLTGRTDYQMDQQLVDALKKAKIRIYDKRKGFNQEQTENLDILSEKARLDEIEKKIPKDDSGLSKDEKVRFKVRSSALKGARRALRNMVANFSVGDLEFFRDEFMDQILGYYQGEKKKISGKDKLQKLRNETTTYIIGIAEARGFDEKGVGYIKDYFRSMFNIEFLVNNSK